ncbi:MAG: D-2-hydroxyacid dehydrogenase [Prevotella sp.]|nr:D-2-hydroxyacid dehydrogenase [Prevotella sp.]
MKLIEMDGYAANPGDISWEPWHNITAPTGEKVVFEKYDRTSPSLTVERAKDADMVLTNKVVFDKAVLSQLPKLKYIGVLATGYNVVDVDEAARLGIVVTNIPAYSTQSVAQLAIAHLLHITNNIAAHDEAVHRGEWASCPDFTFTVTPQMELAGKTLAIVGLGNTGRATAEIAHALSMNVIAFTSKTQEQLPIYINKVETLEQLFKEADVLSLHCPLTPSTKHIINKEHLAMMKPTAIIINTGRGPLIDEQALADALNADSLYAAGIDVLTEEPLVSGSPLLTARHCHITPHIAWATLAARQRLMRIAMRNVEAFLNGKPQNVVN